MSYMDVMSAALSGMQQAQDKLEQTARRVAGAGLPQSGANQTGGSAPATDTVDLSAEMINLLSARQQFSTNARVAHVADQMQKSLLDMLA